jgi:hypothetical protein
MAKAKPVMIIGPAFGRIGDKAVNDGKMEREGNYESVNVRMHKRGRDLPSQNWMPV